MQTTTRSGQHCRGHVDWLVLGTSDIRKPSVGCLAQQLGVIFLVPADLDDDVPNAVPKAEDSAQRGARDQWETFVLRCHPAVLGN